MKKFWENFWNILCWLACVVAILSFIGIIVLICLGYHDIESPLLKYFVYTCVVAVVLFITIFISFFISAMRTTPEERMISALEELDKQLAEDKNVDPFEEFSDTVSMTLITPGNGFTEEDYKKVEHLYLHLTDVPVNELAEILSCEPEILEKQLDAFNYVLHGIDGTWNKTSNDEEKQNRG